MLKRCKRCGEEKPADVFYRDSSRQDGLSRLCKPCTLIVRAEYRSTRRELLRDNARRDRKLEPARGIWQQMVNRCTHPNHSAYGLYGARGIKVCDRWRESFETFCEDMGPRPSLRHSIDRIDVNGNYEPGNCRWATPKEQGRNRRDNRVVSAFGREQCMSAWAEERGVANNLIKDRIDRLGWEPEKAISEPARHQDRGLNINGVVKSVAQWARESGVEYATVCNRLKKGWPAELAVFYPAVKGHRLAHIEERGAA